MLLGIIIFITMLPLVLASCDNEWGHNKSLKHLVPDTYFRNSSYPKHWHIYVTKVLFTIILSTPLNKSLTEGLSFWQLSTALFVSISQQNVGKLPTCVDFWCHYKFLTAFEIIPRPTGIVVLDQNHRCFKHKPGVHPGRYKTAAPAMMYWHFTVPLKLAINLTFHLISFEVGLNHRLGKLTLSKQKRSQDCEQRTMQVIYEDDYTFHGHHSCFSVFPDWTNVYMRLMSGYLCQFGIDGVFQVIDKRKIISLTGRQLNYFSETERPKLAFHIFYASDMFFVTSYFHLKVGVMNKIQLNKQDASIIVFDGPSTTLPKIKPIKGDLYLASTFQCLVHAFSKDVSNILQFAGVSGGNRNNKILKNKSMFCMNSNKSKVGLQILTLHSFRARVNFTVIKVLKDTNVPTEDCTMGDIFAAEEIEKRQLKRSLLCDAHPGRSFISQSSVVTLILISYCIFVSAELSLSETNCSSIVINPCTYTHWCLEISGRNQDQLERECVPFLNSLRKRYDLNFSWTTNKIRLHHKRRYTKAEELVWTFPLQENQCVVVDIANDWSEVLSSGSANLYCRIFIGLDDDYQYNTQYLMVLKGRAISSDNLKFINLDGFFQKYCSIGGTSQMQCQTNVITSHTFLTSNKVHVEVELQTPVFAKQFFLKAMVFRNQQAWVSLVMTKQKSKKEFDNSLRPAVDLFATESKQFFGDKVYTEMTWLCKQKAQPQSIVILFVVYLSL